MLVWHGRLYLIDHGASLYFHHGWDGGTTQAGKPFALVRDHVLLRWADRIADVAADMASRLPEAVVTDIVGQVPDEWLQGPDAFADPATQRAAYVAYLCQRLAAREGFVQEAIRARA